MMKISFKGLLVILTALTVQIGFAQDKTISGTVTDENNQPLPNVNISVIEATQGTQTDFDGVYSIEVEQGQTLEFSSIGFENQTITVGEDDTVDVTLQESRSELEEAIVVAYGETSKESFTGSASVIKSEDLTDMPSPSFEDALNGKAPGVKVTKGSGQVGSTTDIQIRGIGSMNASTQPLYVIDGVPAASGNTGGLSDEILATNNLMNTINSEDIEEITVLKDAAASALYGSRAANGVIMVTTKTGKKEQKPEVKIKSSVGFSPGWATDNFEPASTQENVNYLYRVFHHFNTSDGTSDADANADALGRLNDKFNQHGYYFETSGDAVNENVSIKGMDDGEVNREGKYFDWDDAYFRSAVNQTNDISVRGGSEKSTYFASFSNSKHEGRAKTNDQDRTSGRLNFTQEIGDYVEFSSKVNVAKTHMSGFNDSRNLGTNYYEQTRNLLWGLYWPTDYKTGEPWTSRFGSLAQNNVYYDQEWGNTSKTLRLTANESLKVNILPELSVRTIFSYDNYETKDHLYYSRDHYEGDGLGKVDEMSTNNTDIISSTTLNYDKSFGDHDVSFLAGYEAQRNRVDYQRSSGKDLASSNLESVATAGDLDADAFNDEYTMMSVLTQIQYSFNKKYNVSGSYRRDGSSKFGPDSRWGNFWSVGGSWSINREDFMNDVDFIDNLRLKASYGVNGTMPPSNYGWRSLTGYSAKYMDKPGGTLSNIADENLSWETNETFNAGIDIGLFRNRIFGSIEYFTRDSKDLLQDVPISRVTGFSSTLKNIGSINNKGIEVAIGGEIIRTQDLTWSADVNASFLDSKVKKLSDGEDIIWNDDLDGTAQYIYREGESTLAFYGYEYGGVDPENGRDIFYVNDADNPEEGDFTHNGKGATYDYNKANYTVIGDGIPDVSGGFNTNVNYKGIGLGLNFIYKIGGELYDGAEKDVADDGYYWERIRSKYAYDDMWTEENPNSLLPKVRGTDPDEAIEYSGRHIYDASFLRLKNVRLSYDFPSSVVEGIGIGLTGIKVYSVGTNLFTSSKYKHADPEVGQYASRGWQIPFTKNYTFGIELTF